MLNWITPLNPYALVTTQKFLNQRVNNSSQSPVMHQQRMMKQQKIDNRAIVTQTIHPEQGGWVKFQDSLWRAKSRGSTPLLAGQTVYVVERQNTTLYVEPTATPIDLKSTRYFWVLPG